MIRWLFRTAASILTLAACSLFIAAFAAVGLASFLLTAPFVWGRPAQRRVYAGVDLIGSIFRFVSTLPNVSPQQAMRTAKAVVEVIPEDEDA